jgi:glycosyltransferase involved in cell wall biosynthesis
MVREGNKVCVLTTNANGRERLKEQINHPYLINAVEVIYFNRWTGDHSNFTPQLLYSLWKRAESFDVIHIHGWWNMVSMPAVAICLYRGFVPVLSPRGSVTQYTFNHQKAFIKQLIHKFLGKRLMQKCIIHVTSRQEEADVMKFTDGARIYTIPNFLELKEQIFLPQANKDKLRLVYLGRIDPKKNIDFLLDIVLKDFDVPFSLTFIGDGNREYVEGLKQRTTGNSSIKWLGAIYDETRWKYLAESDILLLPSHNENYGNVVLEALCQGTAAIVSEDVGIKDYILNKQLGWVAGANPDDWRVILRNAWKDRGMLDRIRKEAPSCIQRDFKQDELISEYLDMYRNMAKTRSKN